MLGLMRLSPVVGLFPPVTDRRGRRFTPPGNGCITRATGGRAATGAGFRIDADWRVPDRGVLDATAERIRHGISQLPS